MTSALKKTEARPDAWLNERAVFIEEYELDGVDSFITKACWADTLEDLSDEDLEHLTDEAQDYLVQKNFEEKGWYKK